MNGTEIAQGGSIAKDVSYIIDTTPDEIYKNNSDLKTQSRQSAISQGYLIIESKEQFIAMLPKADRTLLQNKPIQDVFIKIHNAKIPYDVLILFPKNRRKEFEESKMLDEMPQEDLENLWAILSTVRPDETGELIIEDAYYDAIPGFKQLVEDINKKYNIFT